MQKHSRKCDFSLHCAVAAKERDSTDLSKEKAVCVLTVYCWNRSSSKDNVNFFSCLTSYDWSYDVGLFFCLFLMMDCSHHVLTWLDVLKKGHIWYIWQPNMLYLQTGLLSFQTHYNGRATTGHGASLCMQFTESVLGLLCSDAMADFIHVVWRLMFVIYFLSKCFNNKTDLTA